VLPADEMLFNNVSLISVIAMNYICVCVCVCVCVNCSLVDTRWQQYSVHLHTNNKQNNTMKQNTQNRTYITIRINKHNIENT